MKIMLEKHYGELSEGCKRCFKGEKLVLFITGLCPRNCVYCPLSEEKKNIDLIFANEQKIDNILQLLEEVKISGATGAGITGGDPLSRIARTCEFIKALKKEFGKNFHIHLYTSLDLLTIEKIKKLEEAGLDELRVHPDLEDKSLWEKLDMLKLTKMETLIEIPAIPRKEKEILELIKYAKDKVHAFNLNEMELSVLNYEKFKEKKWKTEKNNYTIKGSEKTAKNVIKKVRAWHVRIHYCSARFKDEIQFNNRIKNYAKANAKDFDKITETGTLLRGAIFFSKKLDIPEETEEKQKLLFELKKIYEKLKEEYPYEKFFFDEEKFRILCSAKFVRKNFKKIKNCAIIEEYPTRDKTEIYFEFLS